MPELPEVHTIAKDLKDNIVGYTIKTCEISDGYIALPTNETFKNSILNKKVTDINRIAKNIIIYLNDNKVIHFHLAMTGQILLKDTKEFSNKNWLRVLLTITNKYQTKYLAFNDMRMFGKIAILSKEQLGELRKKYGPEPISEDFTPEIFLKILKSKRTNIKNALLDQVLVSGLGNIYATDALFLAGIHPETKTHELSLAQIEKLHNTAAYILKEGIKNRGSTLPDKMYVDIFGRSGCQQNHFKIYLKKQCPTCNTKVEFKKINGRGTYFCPKCQPLDGQIPLL